MKKISKVLTVAALSTAALSANADNHAAASNNGGLFAGWTPTASASLGNRVFADNFLLTSGETLVATVNVSLQRTLGKGTLGVSEDYMDATGNGRGATNRGTSGTYTNFAVNYTTDLKLPVFKKVTVAYHRLDTKTGGFLQDFVTLHFNSDMGFGVMYGTGDSTDALANGQVSANQYGASYTHEMKGGISAFGSIGNTQQVASNNHSSVWTLGAKMTLMDKINASLAYVKENSFRAGGTRPSDEGFQLNLATTV